MKLFLKKMRKLCKKAGVQLRYIWVMETKRETNPHHHIVMNRIPVELIETAWEMVDEAGGITAGISFRPLDRRGNHAKLASYLIKESKSTMQRMTEMGKRGKRFSCSQNLVMPKPCYTRVEADHWAAEPKAAKGAYLFKWDNGETVRTGESETGWPWQEYFEIYAEGEVRQ